MSCRRCWGNTPLCERCEIRRRSPARKFCLATAEMLYQKKIEEVKGWSEEKCEETMKQTSELIAFWPLERKA